MYRKIRSLRFVDEYGNVTGRRVEIFIDGEWTLVKGAYLQIDGPVIHVLNFESGDKLYSFVNMPVHVEYFHNLRK